MVNKEAVQIKLNVSLFCKIQKLNTVSFKIIVSTHESLSKTIKLKNKQTDKLTQIMGENEILAGCLKFITGLKGNRIYQQKIKLAKNQYKI